MIDQRPLVIVGMDSNVSEERIHSLRQTLENAVPEYRFIFIAGATTATVLPTIPMPSYRGAEERRR